MEIESSHRQTLTPIPSSKKSVSNYDHSKKPNASKVRKINNLFSQLIAELRKEENNDPLREPEVTAPMPSSGWNYRSDQGETKPPKKVSPISSNSSLESDDVDEIVESLVKGKTNVSISQLTKLAKDDSSTKVSSSQCSISTISEPLTTSTHKTSSSTDENKLNNERRNEICLTSSTGECKSNKKLSKKRRLPW